MGVCSLRGQERQAQVLIPQDRSHQPSTQATKLKARLSFHAKVGAVAVCSATFTLQATKRKDSSCAHLSISYRIVSILTQGTHHFGVPHAVGDKLQARVLVLAAERAEAVLRARQVTFFLAWQKPGAADINLQRCLGARPWFWPEKPTTSSPGSARLSQRG